MFHPYRKDSMYLRSAIFASHNKKCTYCGRPMQQRDMHVDHIIAQNMETSHNEEVIQYLKELEKVGFVVDSVENYLPSCPACNLSKGNRTFTAANLRFFHELARKHIDDILLRIEQSRVKSEEFYYEPVDPQIWEELDFSYQRNIAHAIMGYRLTPADVKACPRFPQVEKLKKQLSIVDHVILQGETGCGKSISVYQTAYDYFSQGWRVYRYKFEKSSSIPTIPQNTENSLYIIDDAHLLSNKATERIADQARPNRKVIFSKTVTDSMQADTVLLTNQDAVSMLYQEYIKRKDEILPIVQQCDERIGINFLDSRIEWRLENAKKAATPWQFNYVLRGGWQSIKEQYQTISSHRNCGMLAAIIAAFQIMYLDKAVDYKWLCAWLQNIDESFQWTNNDLQYLIEQKVVLSVDDVRIVHLEGAKTILTQHYKNCDWENDKLRIVIEQAFVERKVKPLGLVWLSNGLKGRIWRRIDQWLISQKMIDLALDDLVNVVSQDDRMGIAFFMEKVFGMDYERNGHWYFCQKEQIMLEWNEHASSENAYAYSRLINTVYNTNHKEHKKFVACINWVQFFSAIDNEMTPNLYAWGSLINRLTAFFSKEKKVCLADPLHATIDKLVAKVNVHNIDGISDFFSQITYLSPNYIHTAIRKLLPIYRSFFVKDMLNAAGVFTSDFLASICGMGFFVRRTTKEQHRTAEALVNEIPGDHLAIAFSMYYPRDWDQMYDIMRLIGKYDRVKAKKIIMQTDLIAIGDRAKNAWDDPHDIVRLCSALAIGDIAKARRFVEDNKSRIKRMYSPLIIIAPQCAIELFKNGIHVDLMTEHWWEYSSCALRELARVDIQVTKEILQQNLPTVAERLNSISTCYMEDNHCLEFIQQLYDFDQIIFYELANQVDVEKMNESWTKSYEGSFKKKLVKQRFEKLLALFRSLRTGSYTAERYFDS